MSGEVEELSEDMRRETDLEKRKSVGKTSLAFFDLEEMNAQTQLVCVLAALVLFGSVGVFFYFKLFAPQK